MCRSIRVLHHFHPPTTDDEIAAAAVQFVRKISGLRAPTQGDQAAFDQAVKEVAETTAKLLAALPVRGAVRTRERERDKAKAKWQDREARVLGRSAQGGAKG